MLRQNISVIRRDLMLGSRWTLLVKSKLNHQIAPWVGPVMVHYIATIVPASVRGEWAFYYRPQLVELSTLATSDNVKWNFSCELTLKHMSSALQNGIQTLSKDVVNLTVTSSALAAHLLSTGRMFGQSALSVCMANVPQIIEKKKNNRKLDKN